MKNHKLKEINEDKQTRQEVTDGENKINNVMSSLEVIPITGGVEARGRQGQSLPDGGRVDVGAQQEGDGGAPQGARIHFALGPAADGRGQGGWRRIRMSDHGQGEVRPSRDPRSLGRRVCQHK